MSTNNNNDKRKIVEDSPKMRSVALVAPPMMPSMRPLTPLKIPSSAAAGDALYEMKKVPVVQKSSVHQNDFSQVTRFPSFPVGYFLERTHVRIHDATPEEVLSRVSAILNQESVAMTFDEKEIHFTCESEDYVEFMLRFFQTEEKNCMLVEAQRVCGCSFAFHQLIRTVLRGAKGLPSSSPTKYPLPLPASLPRFSDDEQRSTIADGIAIAMTLMKQGSWDAQLMGVESLAQITQSDSAFAAETIFGNIECLHVLVSLMQISEPQLSIQDKMHRVAMTVVANCLESLHKNKKLEATWQSFGELLLGDELVMSLLQAVSRSAEQPHEACQAIRVLEVVAKVSVDMKQYMQAHGVPALVTRAAVDDRHARLGQISQQFLQTWDC